MPNQSPHRTCAKNPRGHVISHVVRSKKMGVAMNRIGLLVIAGLNWTPCLADPLVTITCNEPRGTSMEYGTSVQERVHAETNKKPEPKPQLRGPTINSLVMKPTFVVDSGKKKLTVIWSESVSDIELRRKLKSANLPTLSLPPSTEADIVLFGSNQISALEVTPPNVVAVYSFFPKLGVAFITTQAHQLSGKDTQQISTFSDCIFSWSRPQ
jgi:hypothetical protein